MTNRLLFAILSLLIGAPAFAEDVKIQPAAGFGVVITNSSGTAELLRVNDNGLRFLPALLALPSFDKFLCIQTSSGQIGTCAPPAGATGPQGPTGATGPQGPAGITWSGGWNSATQYVPGNAVSNDGSSYVAVAPNTNQPPAAGAIWNVLAQKGADGQSAPAIIQVCASAHLICNSSQDCQVNSAITSDPPQSQLATECQPSFQSADECDPNAFSLTAACPAGYIRMMIVNCQQPDSENIQGRPYYPSYSAVEGQCRYTGTLSKGAPTTQIVAMRMLCIQEFPNPCLRP